MKNLKIGRIVLGMVQTNCYFVYDGDSNEEIKKVIFIDPADEGEYIYKEMKRNGFEIAGILLTHGHFDHIWGANKLRELTGAKIYAYEQEKALCEDAVTNASASVGKPYTVIPDVYVKDKEKITIAGITCEVIATPGHTIGSCCYYFEPSEMLISGDTLFQESVGRTDLATGSASQLHRSITEKLFKLPGNVTVYPGHGDNTTIEYEKKYNPFCQ